MFFFSSRRRHTRSKRDWSSDVCSSDLGETGRVVTPIHAYSPSRGMQTQLWPESIHGGLRIARLRHFSENNCHTVHAPYTKIGRASCRERVLQIDSGVRW